MAGDATDSSSGDDDRLSVESGDDDAESDDDKSEESDTPATTKACFSLPQTSPPTGARASFAIASAVAKATFG